MKPLGVGDDKIFFGRVTSVDRSESLVGVVELGVRSRMSSDVLDMPIVVDGTGRFIPRDVSVEELEAHRNALVGEVMSYYAKRDKDSGGTGSLVVDSTQYFLKPLSGPWNGRVIHSVVYHE